MNIFYLAKNPDKASEYLCDKHVVKMILETAQILCTVFRLKSDNIPDFIYKKTHEKHPCVIWAYSSSANFLWLCTYGICLCDEYTFRYNKKHKSEFIIKWIKNNPPNLSNKDFEDPPQCMPNEYKNLNCIEAYRKYYSLDKSKKINPFNYTKREIPWWLLDSIH